MPKNKTKKIRLALAIIVFFASFSIASSADVTLLQPLPGIGGTTNINTYLPQMYRLLVGVAGILAVIVLVLGGLQYMSTDALSDKKEGRQKMTNAIGGLLLALVSYILLNTINPNLVNVDFTLPTLDTIEQVPASVTVTECFVGKERWKCPFKPNGTSDRYRCNQTCVNPDNPSEKGECQLCKQNGASCAVDPGRWNPPCSSHPVQPIVHSFTSRFQTDTNIAPPVSPNPPTSIIPSSPQPTLSPSPQPAPPPPPPPP